MKVLLVSHYFSNHGGGIEIVADKLACHLAGDVDITWIATGPFLSSSFRTVSLSAFNFFEKITGYPYPIVSLSAIITIMREVNRCDVIHLHDVGYMPNLVAWVWGKIKKKPIIITQHIGRLPFSRILLRMLYSVLFFVTKLLHTHSNRVCFVSDKVQADFAGVNSKYGQVLENGVDTNIFCAPQTQERQLLRLSKGLTVDKPVALFVGRFVHKKGLPFLKDLVKLLPNFHFIFAGWGPLNPLDWGYKNVEVVNHPNHEIIAKLYKLSDVFVLPSKGEGFPLVIQEALAAGLVVLTSTENQQALVGVNEIVLGEIVEPQFEALALWQAQLSQIAKKTFSEQEAISRAKHARARWSWKTTAERYHKIYEEVLK